MNDVKEALDELRSAYEQRFDELHTKHTEELRKLYDRQDMLDALIQNGAGGTSAPIEMTKSGPLLSLEVKAAPFYEVEPSGDYDAKNVRMGALLAGMAFGGRSSK